MDWIHLDRLRFDAIVGILASEQVAPQPLDLEIGMGLDLEACAASGDLSLSVDYAAVAEQVRFVAQQGRWRLIESLATACARLILAPAAPQEARAQVQSVRFRVAKPTILGELAVPGLFLERPASWCQLPEHTLDGATVEVLEQTPLSAAYRVHVAAGACWTPPPQVALRVIAGRPRHGGLELLPGAELARFAGPIENHQTLPVTLLAVGHPIP